MPGCLLLRPHRLYPAPLSAAGEWMRGRCEGGRGLVGGRWGGRTRVRGLAASHVPAPPVWPRPGLRPCRKGQVGRVGEAEGGPGCRTRWGPLCCLLSSTAAGRRLSACSAVQGSGLPWHARPSCVAASPLDRCTTWGRRPAARPAAPSLSAACLTRVCPPLRCGPTQTTYKLKRRQPCLVQGKSQEAAMQEYIELVASLKVRLRLGLQLGGVGGRCVRHGAPGV